MAVSMLPGSRFGASSLFRSIAARGRHRPAAKSFCPVRLQGSLQQAPGPGRWNGALADFRQSVLSVGLVLALLTLAVCTAPEAPENQAAICQRHNGEAACRVW